MFHTDNIKISTHKIDQLTHKWIMITSVLMTPTCTFKSQEQAVLYGIDWNTPLDCNGTADFVEVAPIRNPLSPGYAQLQQSVDPSSAAIATG